MFTTHLCVFSYLNIVDDANHVNFESLPNKMSDAGDMESSVSEKIKGSSIDRGKENANGDHNDTEVEADAEIDQEKTDENLNENSNDCDGEVMDNENGEDLDKEGENSLDAEDNDAMDGEEEKEGDEGEGKGDEDEVDKEEGEEGSLDEVDENKTEENEEDVEAPEGVHNTSEEGAAFFKESGPEQMIFDGKLNILNVISYQ